MQSLRSFLILSALVSVSLLGCDDPADHKPAASVGSARPMASATATATAMASGTATASATAAAAPVVPATITAMGADGVALDASSTVGFIGKKAIGQHEGKFEKIAGWAELAKGKPEGGKVAVQIDLASAKTDDPKLDGHLQSPDFFDVARFPSATFESTEIAKKAGEKGATHMITGNLDLHGVKKSVTFPAKISETASDVSATAEFTINRKDFGIVYAGMADNLISDDVVLKLSIKAPIKK